MSRPPRIANWLPWEHSTVYFITLCVANRKWVLNNGRAWKLCICTFERLDRWTIIGALAMPDHLHLLATPGERGASVSQFVKWFKRWFNDAYWNCRPSVSGGEENKWEWQEGGFDRLLRSEESVHDKWQYIRHNPVRAGLVVDPDDWPCQVQFDGL